MPALEDIQLDWWRADLHRNVQKQVWVSALKVVFCTLNHKMHAGGLCTNDDECTI